MSFKREGDDKSLLGILRQRRIKDLLAVNIPEDEALLTSNGRLSCTVCYHRPIFDTLEMLLIHRQGKKHSSAVEYKKQEKKELQQLILKRKHEQYLKDGTTHIKQAAEVSDNKKLCLGPSYDSRCQRTKAKQPKIKLDLNNRQTTVPEATDINQLPGNRYSSHSNSQDKNNSYAKKSDDNKEPIDKHKLCSIIEPSKPDTDLDASEVISKDELKLRQTGTAFDMILEKQMEGPILHTHQLKNLFVQPKNEPIRITPYQSKKVRVKPAGDLKSQLSSRHTLSSSLLERNTLDDPSHSQTKITKSSINKECNMNLSAKSSVVMKDPSDKPKKKHQKQLPDNILKQNTPVSNSDIEAQKEKAEKYLHLRGAGWKKDLFGKWIKDEDAEFDSDEEEPDLP
ncbi:sodium channel modifier 1-like isoform X1 [Mytilus californianus]|uniref:sodium channel modifier 1-like isoform X1 n=2 Tax=Mytilus californianus TaxID=6549 RepID=UPI002245555E|nr:sodium channel modifier 1-like isoform X1 [Mytilus californianus]XP_052066673.1 sodium channel modifier 1-like isoform X1 [Mytilus californianus]XP_052066674.1 sodium channel modifier 1-like isoform X1 [Mytilus californianus]